MSTAVEFGTISLAIKHAWGESFITGETKPPCPSHVFLHRHGKKPVSLATKRALFVTGMEEGGGGGGAEQGHDYTDLHLTSR